MQEEYAHRAMMVASVAVHRRCKSLDTGAAL